MEIKLLAGQQLQADFGKFTITSDQNHSVGGQEQYPEPFDYFLASMPLCAAFYIRKFCEQRQISTTGITITQQHAVIDENDPYKKRFSLQINLPQGFPEKYRKAVIAAANTCTVKKVIQASPEFDISIGNN